MEGGTAVPRPGPDDSEREAVSVEQSVPILRLGQVPCKAFKNPAACAPGGRPEGSESKLDTAINLARDGHNSRQAAGDSNQIIL